MVHIHVIIHRAIYLSTKYLVYNHVVSFISFQVPYNQLFHRMLFVFMLGYFQPTIRNHKSLYYHPHQVINFQASNHDELYFSYVNNQYPGMFKKNKQKLHFH